MKAYAVGLLTSVVMLVSAADAAATPTPSPPPGVPPWISVPLTGGGGLTPVPGPSLSAPLPSDLPTEAIPSFDPEGVLPTPPRESSSAGPGEPSPSPTAENTARTESRETPTRAPAAPPAPSWQPAGKGHVPPGDYDLFVDPEAERSSTDAGADGQSGGREGLSFGAGGPLLPVLPLGAGIASLGLGLGALGLRMRRRV